MKYVVFTVSRDASDVAFSSIIVGLGLVMTCADARAATRNDLHRCYVSLVGLRIASMTNDAPAIPYSCYLWLNGYSVCFDGGLTRDVLGRASSCTFRAVDSLVFRRLLSVSRSVSLSVTTSGVRLAAVFGRFSFPPSFLSHQYYRIVGVEW